MKIISLFFASWLLATIAVAQGPALFSNDNHLPEFIIDAEIKLDANGHPARIVGELSIIQPGVGRDLCLYHPYNDPNYGNDRGTSRRLDQFQGRTPKAIFEGGKSNIKILSNHTRQNDGPFPFVDRLIGRGAIKISFESVIPRLPNSSPDEWIFDGFYPQLARSCGSSNFSGNYHKLIAPAQHKLNLKFPTGWVFAGPADTISISRVAAEVSGQTLAFALLKNVSTEKYQFGGLDVTVHRRTPGFSAIVNTAELSLNILQKMFGNFPHKTLTIAETFELQRHNLPSLISVNQPKQTVFETAQRDWLNWQHWMMTTQLAMQYYGGVITAPSPEDEWLNEGIVEYATLETLKQLPQRFNLFNTTPEGYRWLSFDYLQISELSIATLEKHAPFLQITDENYQTILGLDDQHALVYSKHANAMRQLSAFAGTNNFYVFLRNLTRHFAFQTLSPQEFIQFITRTPSPFSPFLRQNLHQFIHQWWTSDGYPDFSLKTFKKTLINDGRWIANIGVFQQGKVDFPPIIGVQDKSGRSYLVRATKEKLAQSEDWHAEIITNDEPNVAVIDPLHESYDSNRFNNTTNWPSVEFFPGGASTLRDDGYTVIWLPYPFRRPGEPISFGIQSALFKYANVSLFLRAEYAPQENVAAIQAKHRFNMPSQATYGDITFEQSYENERLFDFSLVRNPLFTSAPQLSLIGRIRQKDQVGYSGSRHESGVIGVTIKPSSTTHRCVYDLSAEVDHAPKKLTQNRFSYERKTSALMLGCALTTKHYVNLRIFGGGLYKEGTPPNSALFKPNDLQEARLRMDLRGLERVEKIASLNFDMMFPFYIPLPNDSLILTRQMRFRVFSDSGFSFDKKIRYSASGLGVQLPLGGDLSGAGALSLTQLSLLAVIQSAAGEKKSRKPGVLLDFTGEL